MLVYLRNMQIIFLNIIIYIRLKYYELLLMKYRHRVFFLITNKIYSTDPVKQNGIK